MKNYNAYRFTFGKYKGTDLKDIDDIKYLQWVSGEIRLDYEHVDDTTDEFGKNLEIRIMELEEE